MLLKDEDLEGFDFYKDQDIILLLNTQGFEESILKAREEIERKPEQNKEELALIAAENIVRNLDLSDGWIEAVRRYIITGNNKMLRTRNKWSVSYKFDKGADALNPTGVHDVCILISRDSSEKDRDAAFSAAKKLFKNAPGYQPRTYLQRDLEMLRLKLLSKIPSKEVAMKINEKYKTNFGESEINDRVSKLKKRLKIT